MDMQDIDWDYEEFGRKEAEEKEIMKGIKKFESQTIYKSKNSPPDEAFLRYEFDRELQHLLDYGNFVSGKLTQMTAFSNPLKNTYRNDAAIKVQSDLQAKIPDEGKSTLKVKDQDERKRVGDQILEFPQTAIGYILAEFNDNTVQRGTGSMIGPNHVITAAHIIYDRTKPARKVQRIRFWPGLKGIEAIFKEVEVARALVLEKYKNTAFKQTEENDVAILILQQAVGLSTGWFGLYNPEKPEAIIKNYEIHGYPEDCQELVQHCVKSKAIKLGKEVYEYENDATSGMNGGPIAIQRIHSETFIEYFIFGIHLRNKSLANPTGAKIGVRLTKDKFDEIQDIIEWFFLKESLDDAFYQQMMKRSSDYCIQFDTSKNVDICQLNNALHALRFNLHLQRLQIRTKTLDNKSVITDESLQIFKHSCQVLRQLKTFKLDIYECSKLTDNGIRDLARGMQNLNDIQIISLFFSNGKQITSVSLKEVFVEVCHMPNLHTFSATLMNMESIDDEGVRAVGSAIYKNQHTLKSIKLHFQTIPQSTEASFQQIVNDLKTVEHLEKLSVTIFGFKFSEEIKNQIKTYFRKLHQLTVL
ncbi:hypothetical protein ABPG72_010156 [Tetrahymena utriculariae]